MLTVVLRVGVVLVVLVLSTLASVIVVVSAALVVVSAKSSVALVPEAVGTESVRRNEIGRGRCQIHAHDHVVEAASGLHRMTEQLRDVRSFAVPVVVSAISSESRPIVVRRSNLVDGHGAFHNSRLSRHPPILSQVDYVFQHETNPGLQI